MPAKKDTLTGGTKDVNPQFYRLSVAVPAVSAAPGPALQSATQSFPVPVPKFAQQNGKAIVMEVLRVKWITGVSYDPTDTNGQLLSITGYLTTRAPQATGAGQTPFGINDPAVISSNSGTLVYQYDTGTQTILEYRYPHL